MKSNTPRALTAALAFAALFCGCTIASQDDETANSESSKDASSEIIGKTDKLKRNFLELTKKCILGNSDKKDIDEIIELYRSSIADESGNSLFFQDESLTVSYEKCMQKAISEYEDNSSYYLDKIITSPLLCARISQRFYAKDDLSNGAFWSRRLLNMVGVSRGYLMLGNVFVKDPKTVKTGAALLAEAAELGNETALYRIQENLSANNIFTGINSAANDNEDQASSTQNHP